MLLLSLSRVRLFAIPWTVACQASLSFSISQSWLKLMSFESMMPSKYLILCHPLLLLPSILPTIRVVSNESALPIRWPKFWSFSFNVNPSNDYSGLISFRIGLVGSPCCPRDFQESSPTPHHSSKASILWRSAFLMVQLSHAYMATGKTIALTRQTFVSKVMSLLLYAVPLRCFHFSPPH